MIRWLQVRSSSGLCRDLQLIRINVKTSTKIDNRYVLLCVGVWVMSSGGNLHEAGHDVNGHGEDNCAIVLRGDPIQGLKIPELQTGK